MNVQTPAIECPVAALAREAALLIEAHKRLDNLCLETKGQKHNEAQHQFDAVEERIYAVGTSASYLRARSGLGVMFQLHQIASLVDRMVSPAGSEDLQERTRAMAESAIKRMLYSIRDEIERITGENSDDACGQYFMPRRLDRLDMVEKALAAEEG